MTINRRLLLGVAGAALTSSPKVVAQARRDRPLIRIGILTDLTGPYRDAGGPNSVACARQAIQEFVGAARDFDVELLVADHQQKADVGSSIVRHWLDQEGVDAVLDVPNSAIALAVASLCRERNKVLLANGGSSADLTGAQCSPNTVQWAFDTFMQARTNGTAVTRSGGDTWFFITPDFAVGQSLQRDTTRFVMEAGGSVAGSARYPFPQTTDFSAPLLQARSSGAKVLGLCNAGADTINCIKQAGEFGLVGKMRIAALLLLAPDVVGLGLEAAQGLLLSETFYWDLNDRTRAFTKRVRPALTTLPNMIMAGNYAAALHYLRAAADMGPEAAKADGRAAVARMKAMPTDDDCFGQGRVREDGRVLHPAFLLQVKTPAESAGPSDVCKVVATIPGEQAFRSLEEGGCSFIGK